MTRSSRNIVLLVLDSVRKDYFDRNAEKIKGISDISVENCRTVSSESVASHGSMFSGNIPSRSGIHGNSPTYKSLPVEETIFDMFSNYRKVGISANTYLSDIYEFDRYFDRFVTLSRYSRFPNAIDPKAYYERNKEDADDNIYLGYLREILQNDHRIESLYNGFVSFIDQKLTTDSFCDEGAKPGLKIAKKELEHNEPTFIFMNLMEGHLPFQKSRYLDDGFQSDIPESWNSSDRTIRGLRLEGERDDKYWNRRKKLYQAEIKYLDDLIYDFLMSLDGDTTVIITGDHGEDFGNIDKTVNQFDIRQVNHSSSLSEGILHVPLEVINPPIDIQYSPSGYVSHLFISRLLSAIKNGSGVNLSSRHAIAEKPAMCQMSSEEDIETQYLSRMIRCCYRDNIKIVWDDFGNIVKYKIDPQKPNKQTLQSRLETVPDWAENKFEETITMGRKAVFENNETVDIGPDIEARLKRLGYHS